jgi:mannose-6-phosphate isomerase
MLLPRRVRAGNFTRPARTPWGGHKILSKYKAGLSLNLDETARIGESWEVSTEPSAPSLLENGEHLSDAIATDPIGWLGRSIAGTYDGQNPLLVKLIDPATTLSVQVHPPESHELLAPDESGKTEAWIVLEAEPGASIYLGFLEGVTRTTVERHLTEGLSLEPLLHRVAAQAGDVFVIRPGVVHALGAGVTVVEPQRVRPGRRAVTYRLWDWNRTFDERGEISPEGKARPLHVRESLAVTDWGATGATRRPGRPSAAAALPASRQQPSILVDEPELFAQEFAGTLTEKLPARGIMQAILCLSGRLEVGWTHGALGLRGGETCVVPAAIEDVRLTLSEGHAIAAGVQS